MGQVSTQQRLSLDTGSPGAEAGPGDRVEDVGMQRQITLERRRVPRNRNPSVADLEDRQMRQQQQRRMPTRPTDPLHSSSAAAAAAIPRGGTGYRYSVELRNDAQKKVKLVEWDYVFVEPGTNKELVRHSFASKEDIKTGKSKKVMVETVAAPYAVISAKGLEEGNPSEKVEIMRVVYDDNTAWEK
ncbi:MAG: hypothetical protein WKF84_30245 [Pyrinomonadaceae bacterium]